MSFRAAQIHSAVLASKSHKLARATTSKPETTTWLTRLTACTLETTSWAWSLEAAHLDG